MCVRAAVICVCDVRSQFRTFWGKKGPVLDFFHNKRLISMLFYGPTLPCYLICIKKYIKKSKICYKITLLLQTCMCGCEFWQNAHPQRHTCVCVCDSNFGKMHTCVRCACGRKSSVRMCVRARPKIVATHSLCFSVVWSKDQEKSKCFGLNCAMVGEPICRECSVFITLLSAHVHKHLFTRWGSFGNLWCQ